MAVGRQHGVVVIYYCPSDEPASKASAVTKFHYHSSTTFYHLLTEASFYFQGNLTKMTLRDGLGRVWPTNRAVWTELSVTSSEGAAAVRLCFLDQVEASVIDDEESSEESKEEDEEDVTKPVTTRPPLYRELFVHLIFLAVLLAHTFCNSQLVTHQYALSQAAVDGFVRSDTFMDSPGLRVNIDRSLNQVRQQFGLDSSGSFDVKTDVELCGWLTTNLRRGLFYTDFNLGDATGSVQTFNRVIGGVRFSQTTAKWQDAELASRMREPYSPDSLGVDNSKGRATETTTVKYLEIAPVQTEGQLAGQALVFEADLDTLLYPWCYVASSNWTWNETWGDDEVLREFLVQIVVYNHNADLYVVLDATFLRNWAGELKSYFRFTPLALTDEITMYSITGDLFNTLRDVRFWLTVINYILVIARTVNEVKVCLAMRSEGRPLFWDYFGGTFSLLEIFNLSCNYAGIILRGYYAYDPMTLTFLNDVVPAANNSNVAQQVGDVIFIARSYNSIKALRAVSIFSAMLLCFKYLELFSRRGAARFYLMGTTLARAGRPTKCLLVVFAVWILATSLMAQLLFGQHLRNFSTLYQSFFTMTVMACRFGGTYFEMVSASPVVGPIFYIVTQTLNLVILIPLFLAIISDAYSVRSLALDMLKTSVHEAYRTAKINELELKVHRTARDR